MTTTELDKPAPLISEEEKFYGYIIALWVSGDLHAMFEYNSETSVYRVPDYDLFKILAFHLCSMAWTRKNYDNPGIDKLRIKKKEGEWIVELP